MSHFQKEMVVFGISLAVGIGLGEVITLRTRAPFLACLVSALVAYTVTPVVLVFIVTTWIMPGGGWASIRYENVLLGSGLAPLIASPWAGILCYRRRLREQRIQLPPEVEAAARERFYPAPRAQTTEAIKPPDDGVSKNDDG
jgi:hypothetical protein